MQCILLKIDECENSNPFYTFFLTLHYAPARSLRSLRSKNSYQLSVCDVLFTFAHGG